MIKDYAIFFARIEIKYRNQIIWEGEKKHEKLAQMKIEKMETYWKKIYEEVG